MNINPFLNLISNILSLYSFVMIVWLIMGWLIRFNILNRSQALVRSCMQLGFNLFEPIFVQVRRIIPAINGIDLSPIIVLLLISFIKEFLYTYFYTW